MEEVNSRAAKIRLLLMDVDGVLTDGKLYFFRTQPEIRLRPRDSIRRTASPCTGFTGMASKRA